MRMPRMQGRPPHCSELIVILSNKSELSLKAIAPAILLSQRKEHAKRSAHRECAAFNPYPATQGQSLGSRHQGHAK
jgi:hypothetical protein